MDDVALVGERKPRRGRSLSTREKVMWGTIATLAFLMGVFGVTAFGLYMKHRHDDGSQSHRVYAEFFCVPEPHMLAKVANVDNTTISNFTNVLVERAGDVARVSINWIIDIALPDDDSNPESNFAIDGSCVPSSAMFLPPCSGESQCDLLNISITDMPLLRSSALLIDSLGVDTYSTLPLGSLIGQFIKNGISQYGFTMFITRTPVENAELTSATIGIVSLEFVYVTNASSSWKVPDYCKSNLCQQISTRR